MDTQDKGMSRLAKQAEDYIDKQSMIEDAIETSDIIEEALNKGKINLSKESADKN